MATRGPEVMVEDAELVTAVGASDRPVATASEVADAVGLSNFRTRQRLATLAENGEIQKARISGGTLIYWLSASDPCSDK